GPVTSSDCGARPEARSRTGPGSPHFLLRRFGGSAGGAFGGRPGPRSPPPAGGSGALRHLSWHGAVDRPPVAGDARPEAQVLAPEFLRAPPLRIGDPPLLGLDLLRVIGDEFRHDRHEPRPGARPPGA